MMPCLERLGRSLVCSTLVLTPCPAFASQPGRPALFQPSEDDQNNARVAYEEGKSAYRVGNFEEAAIAFEQAYQLSGLPDILYNIGLAHLRWYDVDVDPTHLRKAKAVFQNYIIEIQSNPELGDLEQVEALITQIDEKLAGVTEPEVTAPVDTSPARGPDPGSKQRLGGGISMGLGGVFIVGAAASVVAFSLRGQAAEDRVVSEAASFEEAGCFADDTLPGCAAIDQRIGESQAQGQTANALAIGLGASLGGVGVIGLITGAVMFVQGNEKTKNWEQANVRVTPSWSAGGGGLLVFGRF
jgi:tetratricopeptide (TPR) repeat protein